MKWTPLFLAFIIVAIAVIGSRIFPENSNQNEPNKLSDSSVEKAVNTITPKK